MKKTLLQLFVIILCGSSLNGQDPALTANDWELTELSVNGVTTIPSSIVYLGAQGVVLNITDTGTDYNFDTYVCQSEAIGGGFSYPFSGPATQQFTFLFSVQALGKCCNPNINIMTPDQNCVAILGFSFNYFSFWNAPINDVYDYEIVNMANAITLRMTKSNGDYALYNNVVLSNLDQPKEIDVTLKQNPVGEVLFLKGSNLADINEIVIYNLEGNKVINLGVYQDGIDISALSNGLYFLTMKTTSASKTLKFIK